jgi:hypothetical protein
MTTTVYPRVIGEDAKEAHDTFAHDLDPTELIVMSSQMCEVSGF